MYLEIIMIILPEVTGLDMANLTKSGDHSHSPKKNQQEGHIINN